MADIQGRVAFITGGANGIGLGIARSFARAGAKLALVDIDDAALAAAKAELGGLTQVETFKLDVRDRSAYAATAEAAERALGPVTLLFNNAGVAASAPMEAMTFELWDYGMGINLDGVINGVQIFLPKMIERGQGGHVVNTASGAGLAGVTSVLYTTAKFAVVGMSESLNLELPQHDIGVSVLCPGPVATKIVDRTISMAPKANLSAEEEKLNEAKAAQSAEMLKQGVSIDAVGEMVLAAVQNNRFYIHTDRVMEEFIKSRTEALLNAYDDSLGQADLSALSKPVEEPAQQASATGGVDGVWNMTLKAPTGDQPGTLTLSSSGGTLTGNFAAKDESTEILDGAVSGDNLTWNMKIKKPMPLTLKVKLVRDGDSLSGTVSVGAFASFPMVGTRA